MLVLSRRPGEEILIGDDIVVKVVRLEGGRVQIGITAPREISVNRSEVISQPLAVARHLRPSAETPQLVR